jgi:hypothetical protein
MLFKIYHSLLACLPDSMGWELHVIFIEFGRFGKAKLHRPTPLEVVALVALLVFVACVVLLR